MTSFRSLRKIFLVFSLLNVCVIQAGISDYVNSIGVFFGYKPNHAREDVLDIYGSEEYTQKIPYEVSAADEKFISEAAKLTGVALSKLDSCQHRVVLKLQTDCHKMNDEQLAKMAVHLLNCQSFVEGRKMFPCTDEMSIKQCTSDMDSDTWTSYHLMSNRARAVCYAIRQSQFRGLAEHTVNRLMDAARDQLKTLSRIANDQENLKNVAEHTYVTLSKGQEYLSKQQGDLQKAQFFGQLAIEDNIRRLVDEKRLIHETHMKLIEMTKEVQNKMENSVQYLEDQTGVNKENHKELLEDLVLIQKRTQEIFEKIGESSDMLLKQNEDFSKQYKSTLENLQEVNRTVHNLVVLVGGTRLALEERMEWVISALGGTDLAVERLYLVTWHFAFMLLAMLSCAFLSARASTRLVVATFPPLNLAAALQGKEQYLDPISLGCAIGVFILAQTMILSALSLRSSVKMAIPWTKEKLTMTKQASTAVTSTYNGSADLKTETPTYQFKSYNSKLYSNDPEYVEETDTFNEPITPPISRNGHYSVKSPSRSRSRTPLILNTNTKGACHAKTRVGTPCKLSSLPGRDFCYRHQSGDSVMG